MWENEKSASFCARQSSRVWMVEVQTADFKVLRSADSTGTQCVVARGTVGSFEVIGMFVKLTSTTLAGASGVDATTHYNVNKTLRSAAQRSAFI